jgi:hypothetical protein
MAAGSQNDSSRVAPRPRFRRTDSLFLLDLRDVDFFPRTTDFRCENARLETKRNAGSANGAGLFRSLRRHGKRTFTSECIWFFIALAALHWVASRGIFGSWFRRLPAWAFSALLGAGTALALLFVPTKYKPFIYFQF